MITEVKQLEGSALIALEVPFGACRCKMGRGYWERHFEYEIHQPLKDPEYFQHIFPEGYKYSYMCLFTQCIPDTPLYDDIFNSEHLNKAREYALFIRYDIIEQ